MKSTMITLAALLALSACGSSADKAASTTAAPTTAAPTAPTTAAPTTVATTVAPTTTVQALSRDALLASQKCIDALVDDPRDPGSNFVRQVALASIGGDVQQLTDARDLCKEAASQLKADKGALGSPSATVLDNVEYINDALTLADQQIRSDSFLDATTCPNTAACPVTVLHKSIMVLESQTYPLLKS